MRNTFLTIVLINISVILLQSQTISELYKQVSPSVVVIYTQEQVPTGGLKKEMTTSEGLGSGVLISETGDILTAAHVVHNAEFIMVEFSDGTQVSANVIGSVLAADLAHIKLEWVPEKSTIAKIGDSDKANIGDQVIVIGAPYGYERTLSVGHISGRLLKDNIPEGFAKMELLQTDASINRGNSGGPMFNMDGEVVGIVSYILSESGGFEGIGFVISSNVATRLFIDEKAFWSGFESIILDEEMSRIFNLPQTGGLLVQRVVANSPAHEMGLQGGTTNAFIDDQELLIGGDIILEVNKISFADELAASMIMENLLSLNKGDLVTIRILRAGEIIELKSTNFITQ